MRLSTKMRFGSTAALGEEAAHPTAGAPASGRVHASPLPSICQGAAGHHQGHFHIQPAGGDDQFAVRRARALFAELVADEQAARGQRGAAHTFRVGRPPWCCGGSGLTA